MNREWYNSVNVNKSADKFLTSYPDYDYNTYMSVAKTGTLKEFRLLCSVLDAHKVQMPFEEEKSLRAACNNRINEQMGEEATKLFEYFSSSQNHEFWLGDTRYVLFNSGLGHYNDRVIIKSVVIFLAKYKNKSIDINDLNNLDKLIRHGYGENLYIEPSTFKENEDWQYNDVTFNKLNKARQRHVELWITFTNLIWDQKFDEAYKLITDFIPDNYRGTEVI